MTSEKTTKAAVLQALKVWRESNFAADLGAALAGTGWEELGPEIIGALAGHAHSDESTTLDALKVMIVEQMPFDTVIFDAQGRYFYINPSAVKNEEVRKWMIGKTFAEYGAYRGLEPKIGMEVDAAVQKAIKEKRQVELRQVVNQTTEGARTFIRRISPISDGSGQIIFLIGYGMDITSVVENELRLEQQNGELENARAELDQFIYRSSHEMRAPLTTAIGLLDLIGESKDEKQMQEYILMCKSSMAKLDTYIREIVDFSMNNRDPLEIREINFESILKNVWESLARMPGFDAMQLSFNTESLSKPLRLDAERTRMILEALLSNAIRFRDKSKAKNFVKVQAMLEGGKQCIEVEDNGVGISDAHKGHIYNMFFRGNQGNSGSGLGLFLLRDAVEKMGGTIELQSEEGKGTAFKMIFPIH